MNIYLDTSHFQKWQQRKLSPHELSILDSLVSSETNKFIISIVHIFEIVEREDWQRAIELSKFLDKLPIRWCCSPVDLERKELKYAINKFKNLQIFQIDPFVKDFVDTLEPEISSWLQTCVTYRGASIEKIIVDLVSDKKIKREGLLTTEKICRWAYNNSIIIDEMTDVQMKEKQIQKNLIRVIKDNISRFNLVYEIIDAVISEKRRIVDPIDVFVKWLMRNPNLIPSIWCPYYTQHFMLRDSKMNWKKSHFRDLGHLAALPYVNYLSVDKQIYSFAMHALKFAKRHIPVDWNKKLITSVKEICI